MLLSAILSTAVLATESQVAAPLKFKSVLAQNPLGTGVPNGALKDGLDSTNEVIYVNSDSPIGKYTLKAECQFGRAGKIVIEEHLSNALGGFTFNSDNTTGNGNGVGNAEPAAAA